MFTFSISRLSLLLLAMATLTFTSCDDDDDTFLGIDLDDDGTLFLSSNTSGTVGVINLEDGDTPPVETFTANGMDADGLYYDGGEGNLYQVDRTNSIVVEYNDVRDDLDDPNGIDIEARSASDFSSGRGMAYRNDRLVVAQQGIEGNDNSNRLVVFNTDDDNDKIELVASYPTNIALWGIQFVGDALYAVVDKSDSVAIYNNFLSNSAGDSIVPDRYLKIDGITRTHGIQYNEADDIMILTDIGDAGSPDDGALVVIRDFMPFAATGNNTVSESGFTRIAGATTLLGNPVDVDYDEETDRIYVADRASNGGTLIVFEGTASGDATPLRQIQFPGLSSLYLHRD